MELHHLHVAELGAGVICESGAVARALPRVRRDAVHLAGAAACEEQRGAAIENQRAVGAPVGKSAGDPALCLEQLEDGDLHVHGQAVGVHGAILQRAQQLETCAIADVSQARIGVRAKRALVDASLPGAIENRTPALELEHTLGRLLGVDLGHAPVVDQLSALHRVGKVHFPGVLVSDVVQRRRDTAFRHHGVGFAEQRLAYDQNARPGLGRCDSSAQSRASSSQHQHVGLDRFVGSPAHAIHLGSCSRPAISNRM